MLKNVCLQKQKASSPTLFLPTLANYSENFLHITAKKITPKKVKTERSTFGNGGESIIEGQNCINT